MFLMQRFSGLIRRSKARHADSRRRPGCRGLRRSRPLALENLEERTVPSGFNEFALPAGSVPRGITAGPDGNLWFTEQVGNKIGRITTSGVITAADEFPLPTADSRPFGITAGPDGNLWFTEISANKIGRITTSGVITAADEFRVPADSLPFGITAGHGNLWFTEYNANKIGRITTSGVITGADLFPTPTATSRPFGITAGPDGNLWFTEYNANKIGRITTSGVITGADEFPVPTAGSYPYGITAGPDGNLWFTEQSGNKIGRITPAGLVAEFPVPTADSGPNGITAGPDGSIWFTEFGKDKIGRLILPSYFGVSAFINPVPAGLAFALTVRGLDPSNQLANYRGSVHFTSSDGAATLPDDYTFTAADNGAHTFAVTLRAAGRQSVTVTDTVQSNLTGTAASINEFLVPGVNSYPRGITAGPDGNLWVAEYGNKVGRITPDGALTEFAVPGFAILTDITAGPDGNLWFTEQGGNKIGRITPAGVITGEFQVPTASSQPFGITAGPDGNLWFTEFGTNKIARITTSGVITAAHEFRVPTPDSHPEGITAGPDGNLWFTEASGNKIGRITPAGAITEIAVPTANSGPNGITAGPDGNLWFTEIDANKIGRISPGGLFAEFPTPTANSNPWGITTGPDGNLWFTEFSTNKIARITPGGLFAEFPIPTGGSNPYGITAGPDGNLWFTEYTGSKIGRLIPGIDVTSAAADHFLVSAAAGATAGVAFSVTVTALDQSNNPATGYTGTVRFTSSDPRAALPAAYTFTAADRGAHTFTGGITLVTAGAQTITMADMVTGANGSATVAVAPAAADHLSIGGPPAGTAGTAFDVTVTAQDAFNNTATGYAGTVHFASSDALAMLPADYTFQPGDQGVHLFTGGATLFVAGNRTVTAADTVSAIAGSADVTVMAAPAVSFALSAPASVASGGPFDITVTALDPYGNTDTGYTGTVTFTTSDADAGVVLPADYTFQPADGGAVTFAGGFTLVTPGDQTVTATDTASGINGSVTVTVAGGQPPGGSGGPGATFFVAALVPAPATLVAPTGLAARPAQAMPHLAAAQVDRVFAAYAEGRSVASPRSRREVPTGGDSFAELPELSGIAPGSPRGAR